MLWGYDVIATVAALCLLPLALVALAVRREWRDGIGERLGGVPATALGRPAIWLHAASVGEVTAVMPLVRALRTALPDHRLVVSTVTRTGRALAAAGLPEADACILLPLDLRWCVGRALAAVRPRLVLFTETELWPGFLGGLARGGVPTAMVSGRMTARAFLRYRRGRRLFAAVVGSVRWCAVQSLESARRLKVLGAAPGTICVTGSLKGAAAPKPGTRTLATLGVATRPVLVAGSTHAGEEAALLDAWAEVERQVPEARLVLAPRHPERFDEVAALIRGRGFALARRSTLGSGAWPAEAAILLLDTLGELRALYAGARLAFVGGTLVPVGGHNLLEPAAEGVPVVFGPHIAHVRSDAERLQTSGGGITVTDGDDLGRRVVALMTDAGDARRRGDAARAAVPESAGPLAVTLALVLGTLAQAKVAAGAGAAGWQP